MYAPRFPAPYRGSAAESGLVRQAKHSALGPLTDLVAPGKLTLPWARTGLVRKTGLATLAAARPGTTLAISAPAGYGKTTLMAYWARHDRRKSLWISLDRDDDDVAPLSLLLRAALEPLSGFGPRLNMDAAFRGGQRPVRSWLGLATSLESIAEPVLLLIDGIDAVGSEEACEVLTFFIDHLPPASTVATASRARPWLRSGSRGPRSEIVPIGRGQLALTADEAAEILAGAGAVVEDGDVDRLVESTEGWPAGVRLAALGWRRRPRVPGSIAEFSGSDVFVADYLRFEVLDRLPGHVRRFLTRTSVLEEMCGPLCDCVLGSKGSEETLEWLRDRNVFLVALDHEETWWRYHRMFRELLCEELAREEPEMLPELHRRAADWYEASGRPWLAVRHAEAAGDIERTARLLAACPLSADEATKNGPADRWLNALVSGRREHDLPPAVLAGWAYALTGRPIEAALCVNIAEKAVPTSSGDGSSPHSSATPAGSSLALLRALMCIDGVEASLADVEFAVAHLPLSSPCRSAALMLLFQALQLAGDSARAATTLQEWVATAERDKDRTVSYAWTERGLCQASCGNWREAASDLERARTWIADLRGQENLLSAVTWAASALVAVHEDDLPSGRDYLAQAMRLRRRLTGTMPYVAVELRLQLAKAHLALSDDATARALLAEIDAIRRHRPDLGTLNREAEALRAEVVRPRPLAGPGSCRLTPAEQRLLPYFQTNLSFREIGEILYISKNTVKTHAKSIYLKLDVPARGAAVEVARQRGLLAVPS
jgi:LuxR family transcriptional regulator, maltose regulon positive regulatory protein